VLPILEGPRRCGVMTETDGAGISRARRVWPPTLRKNGADIQGTPPQRMQWRASRCFRIGEEFRAAVVEQHDVELFRAVGFAPAGAAPP